MLYCQQVLTLCLDKFNSSGSEVCRKMTPLKKGKVAPFVVSRTKFVDQWCKLVSSWPSGSDVESLDDSNSYQDSHTDVSDSQPESQTDDSDSQPESQTDDDTNSSDESQMTSKKHGGISLAGVHDKIMKERFIGKFDIHVNNLVQPHPSRAIRLLDHDHVSVLTDSFTSSSMEQLVVLAGMIDPTIDPGKLIEEGAGVVEVLGGNHTRVVLQSMLAKGTLSTPNVMVNIYSQLPFTTALAVGYQHNVLLHERRKTMTFMDKVRIMRQCRSGENMSKTEVSTWKETLCVVFRMKDKRRLMAGYQQHLKVASLPDHLFALIVMAVENQGPFNEKFFRPLMRLGNDKIKECLKTLIDSGRSLFKSQVKECIEKDCKTAKKTAMNTKQVHQSSVSEDVSEQIEEIETEVIEAEESAAEDIDAEESEGEEIEAEEREDYETKYMSLKREHEAVVMENLQLKKKNEELKKLLGQQKKGVKRAIESVAEFSKGEKVRAKWVDEDGEEWLTAQIIRINKTDMRVQFECDRTFANVPTDWIRHIN